jgi:hypothetical protein
MNAEGVITLRAENTLEQFALRQWASQAEETTYVDAPGMPAKRPVKAWSKNWLVIEYDLSAGGGA